MVFWICLFVVPVALLTAVLVYLLLRNRSELCHFPAWTAIISGFAAPLFSLWGLTHRNAWRLPLILDHAFVKKSLAISMLAALLGLIWLLRSHRWYSFSVFLISFLATAFWSAVILPF